jgi:hypothetical protein
MKRSWSPLVTAFREHRGVPTEPLCRIADAADLPGAIEVWQAANVPVTGRLSMVFVHPDRLYLGRGYRPTGRRRARPSRADTIVRLGR